MLKDISLGKYYQADSLMHSMDPRIKVILFIVYMVAAFCCNNAISITALALITVAQIITARLPLKIVKNSVTPVLPIIICVMLLNIFSIRDGNVLFSWKILQITDTGIVKALIMAARLLFLIILTSNFLTLTTTPLKLSDALESLFGPLKKLKVPVHEMSMMMSIALRFIPTLVDETDKIMRAQVSRGADFDTGSFMNRLKGYVTIIIPLFVSSFSRAEELAVAMDARCYRGGEGRTKLNPLKITRKDIILGIIFLLGAVLVIVLDKLT